MTYQIKYKDGNPLIPKPYWHIHNNLSQCMPLKEACEKFNYSPSGLIKAIKRGTVQGFKMKHRWYVVAYTVKTKYKSSNEIK